MHKEGEDMRKDYSAIIAQGDKNVSVKEGKKLSKLFEKWETRAKDAISHAKPWMAK